MFQVKFAIMDKGKGMTRVVTVGVFQETSQAKIIIFTIRASDHLGLVEFSETGIAAPFCYFHWRIGNRRDRRNGGHYLGHLSRKRGCGRICLLFKCRSS